MITIYKNKKDIPSNMDYVELNDVFFNQNTVSKLDVRASAIVENKTLGILATIPEKITILVPLPSWLIRKGVRPSGRRFRKTRRRLWWSQGATPS